MLEVRSLNRKRRTLNIQLSTSNVELLSSLYPSGERARVRGNKISEGEDVCHPEKQFRLNQA
jgi:hypothetical protein